MMFNDYGFTGMGFGGLGMLLFWGLIVAMVVVLLRPGAGRAHDRGDAPSQGTSALEIVAQRYARGEIDKAEFDQKRRDLGAG